MRKWETGQQVGVGSQVTEKEGQYVVTAGTIGVAGSHER